MALILEDANVGLLVTVEAYAERAASLRLSIFVATLDERHLGQYSMVR